jgi:hypothetical protein
VRYALKIPYRDGTTHIVLEPPDLMARLAAPGSAPAPGFRFVGQAEEEGDLPQLDLDPVRL